jgi:hypothetical protein
MPSGKPEPADVPEPVEEPGTPAGQEAGEGEDQVVTVELTEPDAKGLMEDLVAKGVLTWRHIAQKILQSLQPPQTATHVPQLAGIRERYPNRKRWGPARSWRYAQYSPCVCGGGLNMTHDHVLPRDILHDKADVLENLRFLCYRCNQSRHWLHGGKLELGTAAASVYLLFKHKPKSLKELEQLGRALGLTQSVQRFEETWALAVYLHSQGKYEIDEIHRTLTEDQLRRRQGYYRETNDFFGKFAEELKKRFADRVGRWERMQLLITTRSTSLADRLEAAKVLRILDKPGIKKIVEANKVTQEGRRALLEAHGGFTVEEINTIVGEKRPKVALYHFLNEAERVAVLKEIDTKLAEFQKKYGVKDEDANQLASQP